MNNNEMEKDEGGKESCLLMLDKFYLCCGLKHQFNSVYRKSEFDNCGDSFDNFKNCIMAKVAQDPKKRQVITANTVPVYFVPSG